MMRAQISDPMPESESQEGLKNVKVAEDNEQITALRPSLLDGDEMMSLLNGFEDRFGVEWSQGT